MGSRESKKKIITERRQQQILDAAMVQFSKKGFDQTTTAEIAQTAGISEGTIYNYYPSNYDLLVALVSRYLDVEQILGLLETALDSSDTDIIHSIIKERLDVVFNNFESLMFLMPEIQRNPELPQRNDREEVEPSPCVSIELHCVHTDAEGGCALFQACLRTGLFGVLRVQRQDCTDEQYDQSWEEYKKSCFHSVLSPLIKK